MKQCVQTWLYQGYEEHVIIKISTRPANQRLW